MLPASSSPLESTSETQLNALASLGLSQYESRCFLASLQTGPATINQIGIVAGVPRTKVYGAVRKLVERGLLEQSEDDPKVFLAKSPKDVLIPLLEKEEKRIKQGIEALNELEVIHKSVALVKRADTLRSKVLRYTPRYVVMRKVRELFQNCRKKVVVLTTANGLIRLSKMSGILFERARLGMSLQVFTSTLDEPVFNTTIQNLREIENSSISLLPSAAPIQVILVDEQYVLVTDLKPDDIRDEGLDVAFLIHNTELTEMMESLIRVLVAVHADLQTAR
ncbi:MAG TPA: helix-turn-helix domain-containing protein [Nitrososphaerales archaeon]|nr:helix-turn-helix domain-containing protein [Nitrososphaerales archaeon]